MQRRLACVLLLLPVVIAAKDPAPFFRVTRVDILEGSRFDDAILQGCDVTRTVSEAFQRYSPKRSSKAVTTTDLVLRIDRVARVAMGPGGKLGATDVAITLLSAGAREQNQAFFCRAEVHLLPHNPTQCSRVDECSGKIADQVATWLSWQTGK